MKSKYTKKSVHSVLMLAAFSLEEKALLKALERAKKGKKKNRADFDIKVFNMGAGKKRSRSALEKYLDRDFPDFVLLTGVAGGVSPGLRAGDIVFPKEVCTVDGSGVISESVPVGSKSRENFKEILKNKASIHYVPKLATVNRLFHKKDKARLRKKDPNIALVDMESYAVVDLLRAKKIPFLLFRVVSDPFDSKFPDDSFFESLAKLCGLKKAILLFKRPGMCLRFLGMLPALNQGLRVLTETVFVFISNAGKLTVE